MRAKIDINEVERRTKIRAKYLRAIENEEWDLLPGDVYARSFLRTYGEYLGLDTRALLDDYKRLYDHPSDQELRPIAPPGRERERQTRGPRGLPAWALIGVVLVALVAVLYFVGENNKSTPPAPTGTSRKEEATATATLKSIEGSTTLMPPAILRKTSWEDMAIPNLFSRIARIKATRLGSIPPIRTAASIFTAPTAAP